MKRFTERLLLLAVLVLYLAASGCYASGGYAGYGYGYNNYYDDAFYSPPIDRYGYGFYGHP
ncbi:MAG: hypothetical protein JRD92_12350 [Deltaproteobacteria bacterium]|nr:hypothetical protein [Deltaproteobacteria bacterium]MBW2190659.1 hypothetical protein [Deltaproteobacteria bacterium]MBW2377220.1 hypothetical protein [Deltaproteobacteria bacterium]MBW2587719.1 hypothetical protein [Deltaproteobacteria bacterium]